MSQRPLMDGKSTPNVYDEHKFYVTVVFGASTAFTGFGQHVTVTRPTDTTLVVTFPQPYAMVTSGGQLWKKATGADPLQADITTDALTTSGALTFTIKSTNSAGTATAPASGDVLYLQIGVSDHALNADFTQSS